MHQDELFIGGSWQPAATGERIEVVSPHTESPVATVAAASPADVDKAVEAARSAFDVGPWPRLAPAARVDAIRRLTKIYGERRPEMAGSVWTADADHGVRIAERIRTGTFGVNQGYTMDPLAPFGGVKGSGYGRELGREGIDGYTDSKSIAVAGGKTS